MKRILLFMSALFFSGVQIIFSQIEQETIDIEKSYNPAVQEVKKLDESPKADLRVEKKKLKIHYSPINLPVKSDYKLAAIHPVKLPPKNNRLLYNSYLKAGGGYPLTTLLDSYIDYEYDTNRHLGAFLHHFSTDTKAKNARVDDNQSQNNVELFYKMDDDGCSTKLTAGYDRSIYHYYGIADLDQVFSPAEADKIYHQTKVKNDYQTFYLNAGLDGYKNRLLNNSNLLLRYFTGDFGAKEFYTRLNTELAHNTNRHSMPLNTIYFKGSARLNLEYINTDFEHAFNSIRGAGFFKASLAPFITITNDINYLTIGIDVTYNNNYKTNNHKFRFYPHIEAMVKAAEEFSIYGGLKGGLKNNNYYDLVQNNPWITPGVSLKATNTRYNIYGGIKGIFSDVFQYKGEVSYAEIKNFLLMANTPLANSLNPPTIIPPYRLENSFYTLYDHAKNLSIKGELNYVGIEHLTTTLTAAFYHYDLNREPYAWNYPDFTTTLAAEYKLFNDQLTVGTDLYYIGERKDIAYDYYSGNRQRNGRVILNDYIDANLRSSYRINDRWGAFLKWNNIFGSYERFKNYQTQGAQILGGVTYKFSVKR